MMNRSKQYWEHRYLENNLGWDIGYVSPPLKSYIDQLANKDIKILVPGAGNGYEATYLFERGFKNVYVVDIAQHPLSTIKARTPEFPSSRLIRQDFFEFSEGGFDLIIEQTFFCSLPPTLRTAYALKMSDLLKDSGKLVGLLFDFKLSDQGPPFGGSPNEYKALFNRYFNCSTLEKAYNSIEPRKGKELFFIFEKLN